MSENMNEKKDVVQIVEEIRVKAEKFGTESAEFKSFSEKAEDLLAKQEAQNQKILADMVQERKSREELQEKFDDLQVSMARKSSLNNISYKETDEYKALNMFVSKGENGLNMDTKQLLRSDNDTQGGYLTSSEMDRELIRKITEISPIRQVARVRTISKKTLEIPKRDGILTASYEGEAEATSDSTSSYGAETITAYALTVNVPLTNDILLSTDFDVESEINQDVAEAFGKKEGERYTLGTGVKEPEGFLSHPDVIANALATEASYAVVGSNAIQGDDIIKLTGELKVGYNPIFGFNRQTLAYLRTLKGGDGQYLWQVGLGGAAQNQIAGEPYMVMQDIPSRDASGNLAIIYGDFLRGYQIVDRTGLTLVRDEVTRKTKRIIEICFTKYNTGQVVLSEAFKALKIKA